MAEKSKQKNEAAGLLASDGAEPTYRMSMLPFGTYANPDGTESLGLALPGMLHEPLQALGRLFGTPSQPGTFGQGPDYPGNSDDMRNLLFSVYGGNALNPGKLAAGSGFKDAAQAAYRTARHPFETAVSDIPAPQLSNQLSNWPQPVPAAAPQRMYHGTGAADDFSSFRPSDSGALGPGVYLSNDPAYGSSFAGSDAGARVLPLDVSGPFASIDDYLTTLHANGRNPEAAQRAMLDQGYTGVSGDIGGPGFSNVTNVFKPGSVRSATTGETLFSDTGKPSLLAATAGTDEPNQNSPVDLGRLAAIAFARQQRGGK